MSLISRVEWLNVVVLLIIIRIHCTGVIYEFGVCPFNDWCNQLTVLFVCCCSFTMSFQSTCCSRSHCWLSAHSICSSSLSSFMSGWISPSQRLVLVYSFIHYWDLYSASSRLLLRSASDLCMAKKNSFQARVECQKASWLPWLSTVIGVIVALQCL